MQASATKTLWWGIGLFIFGAVALVALPWLMSGMDSFFNLNTVDRTIYFSVISPLSVIIQFGAFPLGGALIAASVVLRHMNRWFVTTTDSEVKFVLKNERGPERYVQGPVALSGAVVTGRL